LLIAIVEDPVRSFRAMIASLINPIVAMVPLSKVVRCSFGFDAPISTFVGQFEGSRGTW
jgi:hypothetical protein